MGEFIIFLSSLFVFGTATAFVVHYFRRQSGRLDPGIDHEVLARLLEDTDGLSTRLDRIEEELEFFKKLNAPAESARLSPPETEGEGS